MKDQIILADGVVRSMDCNKTGLNNNTVVIGGTGSGKSMSFVESNLLRPISYSGVIPVTKRRIANKYAPLHKKMGTKVYDLNFSNPMASDIAYDPMDYVKTDADIRFLAESLVYADPQKKASTKVDPYFDDTATSLLCAEIGMVKLTVPNAGMTDVLDFHSKLKISDGGNGMIETTLDSVFDCLEKKDPACYAVACWKSFRSAPIRTAGCVYSSLNISLDKIFTSELKEMMKKKEKLRLERLTEEKSLLFVTTSPVNKALHSFTAIFYAQLFKVLFEKAQQSPNGELPIPVHVIADDAATGCKIPNLAEYLSICREARISVMLLLQSESQLASIYGSDDATTILNNCDTLVYTGSMDLKTAKTFSERANLPLGDVLYMPVGQVMIFRRGEKPIIAQRYNIMEDERWKALNNLSQEAKEACA